MRFRVAPTTLTFHDVTDLSVTVDFGDSGYRTAISELAIDHIGREPVPDQQIGLDRPYFRFRIVLNLPPGGALTFGASGFSQVQRAEPVVLDQQKLAAADRA